MQYLQISFCLPFLKWAKSLLEFSLEHPRWIILWHSDYSKLLLELMVCLSHLMHFSLLIGTSCQLLRFDIFCLMLCNLKLINFMCIAQLESIWPISQILIITYIHTENISHAKPKYTDQQKHSWTYVHIYTKANMLFRFQTYINIVSKVQVR